MDSGSEEEGRRKLTITLAASGLAVLFLLLLSLLSILSAHNEDLASRVAVENILVHLNAFQSIALLFNNSRSVSTGFNASAEYVLHTLTTETDQYTLWTQPFVAITYTELSPPSLSQVFPAEVPFKTPIAFALNTDFRQPRYGGNGTYELTNASVWEVRGSGCREEEYTHTAGGVALVSANTDECDLYTKATKAEDAGAKGLLVWSSTSSLINTRIRLVEWREGDRVVQLPVLSVSQTVYQVLTSSSSSSSSSSSAVAYVNLFTQSVVDTPYTFNVFAETKGGNKNAVVFAGAHLDSVAAGPGMCV